MNKANLLSYYINVQIKFSSHCTTKVCVYGKVSVMSWEVDTHSPSPAFCKCTIKYEILGKCVDKEETMCIRSHPLGILSQGVHLYWSNQGKGFGRGNLLHTAFIFVEKGGKK